MFPRRSQWGEVQTWVNSQWKIPTFPGQISTEINRLTDAIASYQHTDRVLSEHFQVWHLTVDAKTRSATLTMKDGNSDAAMITQAVEYTDFPLNDITLWLVRAGQSGE